MLYVITQKCIGTCDTACVDVCPVDCIEGLCRYRRNCAHCCRRARPDVHRDPDRCTSCGACEPVCPADAIYLDDRVPDEHRGDIARNAAFFARR